MAPARKAAIGILIKSRRRFISFFRGSENRQAILEAPLRNWNDLVFTCLFEQAYFQYILRGVLMARTVKCIKLGKEAEGLDFPPYPGELGKRIYEHVSKEAWAQWLKQQTMLVNENRLNLADQRARQYPARQMENHFFGQGAAVAPGYGPP